MPIRAFFLCLCFFLFPLPSAIAQSMPCTTDPAPIPRFGNQSVAFDLGTCFVFDGGSPAFTWSRAWTIEFDELFVISSPALRLDYSMIDSFLMRFDVTILNASGSPISDTVTFLATASGEWSAPANLIFAPGMRIRIVGTAEVLDENSQCFANGYYCYYSARFTLH